MKKLNFDALAKEMVESGSGQRYTSPPWEGEVYEPKFEGDDIHYPIHPGDKAYFQGPYILRDSGDLPQKIIDAHNKSFRDAISIYMPPRHVAAHLCSFFQSDFLNSPSYQRVYAEIIDHIPSLEKVKWGREYNPAEALKYPPESLSFSFDDFVRKNRSRAYYTMTETEITEKICHAKPNLYKSFFAFQAGIIDYLSNLRLSLAFNHDLKGRDRPRALNAIDNLTANFGTTRNFVTEMLPAICAAYYKRDPEMITDVSAEDFKSGFQISLKVGLFRSFYEARNDNSERKFTCPAASIIGTVMARNEDHLDANYEPASMIGMIYKILQSRDALERTADPAPSVNCG